MMMFMVFSVMNVGQQTATTDHGADRMNEGEHSLFPAFIIDGFSGSLITSCCWKSRQNYWELWKQSIRDTRNQLDHRNRSFDRSSLKTQTKITLWLLKIINNDYKIFWCRKKNLRSIALRKKPLFVVFLLFQILTDVKKIYVLQKKCGSIWGVGKWWQESRFQNRI